MSVEALISCEIEKNKILNFETKQLQAFLYFPTSIT